MIKGFGTMVDEGRPLKAISVSNTTSCDDAERADWNVTAGRLTSHGRWE